MTLQALPQQPTAFLPSSGYHAAALAEDSESKAIHAIEDASDEYWKGWERDCKALMELMFPRPGPAARLRYYQNRPTMEAPPVPPMLAPDGETIIPSPQPPPTGSWFGQMADFPPDYEEDMADWVQLEPVSVRRDQVMRDLAMVEMGMIAQAGMTAPPELVTPAPTSGEVGPLPEIGWPE